MSLVFSHIVLSSFGRIIFFIYFFPGFGLCVLFSWATKCLIYFFSKSIRYSCIVSNKNKVFVFLLKPCSFAKRSFYNAKLVFLGFNLLISTKLVVSAIVETRVIWKRNFRLGGLVCRKVLRFLMSKVFKGKEPLRYHAL